MSFLQPVAPNEVVYAMISACDCFPNNPNYPLLIYKKVSVLNNQTPQEIQAWLKQNGWGYSWIDGIYDYHHYHSRSQFDKTSKPAASPLEGILSRPNSTPGNCNLIKCCNTF